MKVEAKEKRDSERVSFTIEENIGITINPGEKNKAIPANLLSLSTGGISIATTKKQEENIQEGDVLIVSGLHLPGFHEAIARIEVEVKHILFYKDYDRMSIGCEFKNISDPVKEKIEAFINEHVESVTTE